MSRIEEDGKKWFRRPKLCTKGCTALLRRRRMAKYTWKDCKTNKDILSELKINLGVKKIQNYRNKWIQHVW